MRAADGQSTTAQLKDDINRGRTGDKVNLFDPASAPLGTDDEAAGTPASPTAVTAARVAERRTTKAGVVPTPNSGSSLGAGVAAWVGIVGLLVAAGFLIGWMMLR